jgi:hypothetical protein
MDYHALDASITGEDAERVPTAAHLREMARSAYRGYRTLRHRRMAEGSVTYPWFAG